MDAGHTLLAHGLGSRSDLPVSLEIASLAGGIAIVASFVVLLALWKKPRLRGDLAGRGLPAVVTQTIDSRIVRLILPSAGLVLLCILIVTAWTGPDASNTNPAPTWLYVWFWVGLVPLSMLFGPIYRLANPLRLISSVLHARLRHGTPADAGVLDRMGYAPAIVGLLVFLWIELVSPSPDNPRMVALFVTAYSAVHLGAGMWFGPRWFDRGDGFEVYFSLVGRLAPIGRRTDGALAVRNPLDGLLVGPQEKGLTLVILTVLGSTAFDGITRLPIWRTIVNDVAVRIPSGAVVAGTFGLLAVVAVIVGSYGVAVATSEPYLQPKQDQNFYVLFAHSLIPIMIGYAVAHYFSLLVFQGQAGYLLVTGGSIDYSVVGTTAIALVQIGAILSGHIAAVISAHDQAVAVMRSGFATIGQVPMIGLMVSYTMVGIMLVAAV